MSLTPEQRSRLSAAFTAVVKATTDDPSGHLPNCGYTHEEQTCGCAEFGDRLHAALRDILAAEREAGAAEVIARVEAVVAELFAFDCLDDMVPSDVDVPDDFEHGIHDAARRVRAALHPTTEEPS